MATFSEHFGIGLPQPALDFVDVPLDTDLAVYVDPFAISLYDDELSRQCNDTIIAFFQMAISSIRSGNTSRAERMLRTLREPNETRLGVSSGSPRGRGVSGKQALDLYNSIANSQAAKTGLLSELSECDLFVDGIGADKISDMATNILRDFLIDYTQAQCDLHNIPLSHQVSSGLIWDPSLGVWREKYVYLPTYDGTRVILIPKNFVRHRLALNSQEYLNKHVLEFLQAEHLSANTSLVEVLRNGTRRVSKKVLKENYPCTKEWMASFSQEHPDVLGHYKNIMERRAKLDRAVEIALLNGEFEESTFAQALIEKLASINPGNEQATEFHNLSKGIIEFLFWPNMINPVKEKEIHDGRKRIDIMYTNAAADGFFFRALNAPQTGAVRIPVECKNYTKDPANPEIDQIAGRFAPNRGWMGFLIYRTTAKYELLIQRCRDTAGERRGFILPLGDSQIIAMLEDIANGKRRDIDRRLNALLDRIIS